MIDCYDDYQVQELTLGFLGLFVEADDSEDDYDDDSDDGVYNNYYIPQRQYQQPRKGN